MRSFKDQVKKDLDVFIDPDIFGEPHTIKLGDKSGEKTITIVIDNDELMRRQSLRTIHDDGTFKSQVLFFCRGDELGSLPDVGSVIELDSEKYKVYDAKDDSGIYAITLEKYSSRGIR